MSNPASSTQNTSSAGTTQQSGFAETANAASGDISNLMAALNSILSGSGNFSQFSQPQIQNLSNTLDASNASETKTIQGQLGGVANPAALIQSLNTQNAQSGMQTTEGLQSVLGGQSLEALLGPLSSIASLLSGNTTKSGQSAGGTTGSQNTTSTPSLLQTLFGL